MTEQEIVDCFAQAAKPRLMELLRLKARHIYEVTPGSAGSKLMVDGVAQEVQFKLKRCSQPYKDIERFAAPDKVIGFVVNPGLLPLVKAILLDIRGRNLLVTRRIEARQDDQGVVAHLDMFGIRILMSHNADRDESELVWELLYAVA